METYEILLIIFIGIFILFISLGLLFGSYFAKMIYDPYCLPSEEVLDKEINHHRFTLKEFKSYKFEDFEVTSRYGYTLKGSYIRKTKDVSFKDGKERVVILVHGWTSNRYSKGN